MEQKINIKGFPGPKTLEWLEEMKATESQGDLSFTNYDIPPVIEKGEGCYIKDIDGNIYLDFTSGFSALNLGHCPKEVIEAVYAQMNAVHHTAQLPSKSRIDLLKKLKSIAPGKLRNNCKIQYDTGGTNAVEVGMKLAKSYTGRPYVMCYTGAYHGRSFGTLAVTANPFLKRDFMPIMPGAHRIPYPYCYRCPFGRSEGHCEMECVHFVDTMFNNPASGFIDKKKDTNLVAGILFEPCQGAGGYIIPPKDYWKRIQEICEKYDLLLIDDEIQMGWGRTGEMFSIENFDVSPDIVMVGKAFTAGVVSNAATISTPEIMDTFEPIHQSVTFSGNPVGSAAVLAMIKTVEEKNLLDNSKKMGEYFYNKLLELQEKHSIIGQVQGLGLALSLEFVKDRKTKEPASKEAVAIIYEALHNGLVTTTSGHFGNRMNIVPPLIVTENDIDSGIQVLDAAIATITK